MSENVKKYPLVLKIVAILVLAAILIVALIYIFPKSKNDNGDTDYVIENARLRLKLEDIEKDLKATKFELDSISEKYDSINTDVEDEKITNKYKDEKNHISTLPIDSTVSNLSKWVSKNTSSK